MKLRLLLAFLLLSFVGCSVKYWETNEYAHVYATRHNHTGGVPSAHLLKILDTFAQHLYAEGFIYQSNDPNPRLATVFTQNSSFRDLRDFDAQTIFQIVEAPTQSVLCVVHYTGSKEIYVSLSQEHVTSHERPQFPLSAARKTQLDRLVDWTRVYLQEKLPDYHLVVSSFSPST